MATDTATETAAPADLGPAVRRRAQLRNLHETVMVDDAAAVLRQNRAAVDTHHRTFLDGYQSPAEEEMRVDSPNTTTINHYPQPAASGMGTAAKLAAAGLVAGGLGLPVGAGLAALPLVADALKNDPPAAVSGPDADTMFDLRLGAPDAGAPEAAE